MEISFYCSDCGRTIRVPEEQAGKKTRCPLCNASVLVPERKRAALDLNDLENESSGPTPDRPAWQQPFDNPYAAPQSTPDYPTYRPAPRQTIPDGSIPTYLTQSILVTLFCCIPFGVVSIVYAAQVEGKMISGDYAGAHFSSDKARSWCWISFWCGLIPNLIFVIAALSKH
jgi:DNA-directed RNA polymerase subunit RPC12/RpoP